ncbi:hypothetical protein BO86DRAFT_376656 [Aspergillus japonicus CBS 114.51]|uniref:Telomeric single stranded DNA binding POT1/Cdc13 domain-containing protein n=1 Tax=Aspergillus japonicus CBS 114.51 TaxID=1448312 RepID=A0A8T8XAG5_ASPJA|nr:hypothetical protein BO86DRAFT_376656 [Aspergillus japonicus CBS 114.51]RAH85061.1 hypothetical protein BO86DRAFT_376656 [Aspergillus japonicus CBS 114.51]
MDAHDKQQAPVSELLRSTPVPIAQLSPSLDNLPHNSVRGVVALLWPYSSSTRSISLLLAEPDFRLRRSGGQVRVVFHGPVAEEVAKSHVGIGDNVYLSLHGSRLTDNDPKVLTPGKSVAWDVHFETTVLVEVWRSDQHLSTVQIDPPSSPLPAADSTTPTPTTPDPRGSAFPRGLDSATWQSPAFLGPSRTSSGGYIAGSTLHPAFDPFAEDDGFVPGKGRKRTRFSLRNDWRLVDEPASPEDLEIPGDWTAMFDDEAWLNEAAAELEEAAEEAGGSPEVPTAPVPPQIGGADQLPSVPTVQEEPTSAVPDVDRTSETPEAREDSTPEKVQPKPDAHFLLPNLSQRLEFSRHMHRTISDLAGHLPTDTPRLNPIPSPGLPIPSPLVSSSNSPLGYFGSVAITSEPATSDPFQLAAPKSDPTWESSHAESEAGFGAEIKFIEHQAQGPITVGATDTPSNEATESAPDSELLKEDSGLSIVEEAVSVEENVSTPALAGEAPSPERDADLEMVDADSLPTEWTVTEMEHETFHGEADDHKEKSRHIPQDEDEYSEGETDDRKEEPRNILQNEDEYSEAETDDRKEEPRHMPQDEEEYSEAENASAEELEIEEHEDELASQASEPRSVDLADDNEQDVADDARPTREPRTDVDMASDDEAESVVADHGFAEGLRSHHDFDEESEEFGEDMSDEGDLEDVDEDEDELDEEDGYDDDDDEEEYDDHVESESDPEDLRAEAPQPKRKSPEIIVLDSDSEDEPAPVQPNAGAYPRPRDASASDSDRSGQFDDEASGSDVVDEDEEEIYDEEDMEDEEDMHEEDMHEEEMVDEDEDTNVPHTFDAEVEDAEGDVVSEVDEWTIQDERHAQEQEPERGLEERESDNRPVHEGFGDVHSEAEDTSDRGMIKGSPDDEHEQPRGESPVEESVKRQHTEAEESEDEQTQAKEVESVQLEEAYVQKRTAEEADPADHMQEMAHEPESVPVSDHDMEPVHNPESPAGIQEIQTTTLIHGPGYESLEFFSSRGPGFEHVDHSAGPFTHSTDLPIDPALLESATSSAPIPLIDSQHSLVDARIQPEDNETALADQQQVDAGLSLDGASESLPISAELSRQSPSLQLDHQLITPEPSQFIGMDKLPSVATAANEIPPTPEPTQADADMQDVESEEFHSVDEGSEAESYASAPSQKETHRDEGGHGGEDPDVHATHSEDEVMLVGGDVSRIVAMNRNYPGLRSKLSYFAPLATLVDHFRGLVDTISTVAEVRPVIRATSGKKDYILTLGLTDPSLAGTMLFAQIFRPHKTALPSVTEGDAVLLRDFQVKSFNHAMMLASVETSAWAVFTAADAAADADAQVSGPPVEYGPEEATHATDLRQWYQETGMAMVADHQLQASIERDSREATPHSVAGLSDTGSVNSAGGGGGGGGEMREASSTSNRGAGGSRRRKSHRRITIHELRDGRRYAEVGSPTSRDSIHELRDGTVYANL